MSEFQRVRTALSSVGLCVALCGIAGCADSRNRSNGITGLEPGAIPALVADPASSLVEVDAPSLVGLDRRGWDLVLVEVPRGQIEVQPTYGGNLHLSSGTSRTEGIYPTTATALQGQSLSESVFVEGALQPAWAAISLAGSPVHMAQGAWPWSTRLEPRGKYEVVPSGAVNIVDWRWVERPAAAPSEAALGMSQSGR
ncbi:MAG: hypothetical protein EXS03_00010 [Phycisphaerales bacterium]|nr:hypothetical protein [Phycisphaerales bacterium]